jgi:hypothetical protein
MLVADRGGRLGPSSFRCAGALVATVSQKNVGGEIETPGFVVGRRIGQDFVAEPGEFLWKAAESLGRGIGHDEQVEPANIVTGRGGVMDLFAQADEF